MALSSWIHVSVYVILLAIINPQSYGKGRIIHLTEENWGQILEGEWMVEFFAPWCPACKSLEPAWKDFADWSEDLGIRVGQVDVTINPGLSGRFMVTSLPTIFHVHKGQFRQYRGSREKDDFISFIEEKKWESMEEIPGWKTPNSLQMSLVSYFFKLSMILRSIHTSLIEDYGLPYWCSYLIFAFATIMIGAILGLIIVCVIDFVFPPKPPVPSLGARPESFTKPDGGRKKPEDDDVIEDDSANGAGGDETVVNEDVRKRKTARKDD